MKEWENKEVLFQVVNHLDGTRSPPIGSTMKSIAEKLSEALESDEDFDDRHDYLKDLVLINAEKDSDEFVTSAWPLMTISNFIDLFMEKQ